MDFAVREGLLADRPEADAESVDLVGCIVAPGLVDLHCDAIEKAVEPRPGVQFPLLFAIEGMDRRAASSGITTIYHAISFAGQELGLRNPAQAMRLIEGIMYRRDSLHVRHRIHLRYETGDAGSMPLVMDLLERGGVDLLSFMDHTPGQGQFLDDYSFIRYLMLTYGKTEREARHLLRVKRDGPGGGIPDRVQALAAAAKARGVPLACHDLHDPMEALMWSNLGVGICEFPLTLESASAAHRLGMTTVFGSPNVVRGESSGTGMKALTGIRHKVADCICSDYVPEAILPAIALLSSESGPLGLGGAFAMATANAAAAVGDSRIGTLCEGAYADFLVLGRTCDGLSLRSVWARGREVFRWGR